MIWVPLAILVWVIAGGMLLTPRRRPLARSLALAMAGTFPGVFLFQFIAAPVVILILLGTRLLWKTLEPGASTTTENPFVIAVSIASIFLVLAIMLGMSIAGFCEGWRIGWMWGKGSRLPDVIRDGFPARLLGRLLSSRERAKHA